MNLKGGKSLSTIVSEKPKCGETEKRGGKPLGQKSSFSRSRGRTGNLPSCGPNYKKWKKGQTDREVQTRRRKKGGQLTVANSGPLLHAQNQDE